MKMLYITKMLRTWKRHLNFQVGATTDRMHILHDVVHWSPKGILKMIRTSNL